MPVFRMDFYVQATLENEVRLEEDSRKMLEALKSIEALKNVKMTTAQSAGKTWIEYEANIDVPQGSKAFFALLKRKDGKDPYNIFLRIDINREADTRENAEKETGQWVEEVFAVPLKGTLNITEIQIGTPLEIIRSKRSNRGSNKGQA
nr:hypothetical protein [Candidatus Njordarchaeota archaeon]